MLNNKIDNFSAYQAYPDFVRPFLVSLENHPVFQNNFTHWSKSVAIDILARIRINDASAPILLRMSNVARAIGVCTKTVQRVVNHLKELGWITQEGDGRDDMGCFSFRKFIVSKEVREMMGICAKDLSTDFMDKSIENNNLSTKNIKMSNGLYGVNKNLLLKEAFLKKDKKPKLSTKRGIPGDLIEMQEILELDKGGVCTLMTLCKARKKRLQDVWEYMKQRILDAGVKAGRAFRYIEKLISSYDVWQKVSDWQEKIFPKDKVLKEDDNRRYWHKRFRHEKGFIVKTYDGIAEVISSRDNVRTVAGEGMEQIYRDIKLGILTEVIL